MSKEKVLVVRIPGGIGKNIAFTAVLPALKKKYQYHKIFISTGWIEVYENNPYIYRACREEELPSYSNEILNADFVTIDPYWLTEFHKKQIHLIEGFCRQLQLEYDREEMKPQLYPSVPSLNEMKSLIEEAEMKTGKEVIFIQYAGVDPLNQGQKRAMPLTVINEFTQKIKDKYLPVIVGDPKQIRVAVFSLMFQTPLRVMVTAPKFRKFIGIDSFFQHAAASYEESCGAVFWGATSPKSFGYNHPNIINFVASKSKCKLQPCNRPRLCFHDITWRCPEGGVCVDVRVNDLLKVLEQIEKLDKREFPNYTKANINKLQQKTFNNSKISKIDNLKI